jgi:hypothetical protein
MPGISFGITVAEGGSTMNKAHIAILLPFALITGCSGAPESSDAKDSTSAAGKADMEQAMDAADVRGEASAETQTELGVKEWGAVAAEDGVYGYGLDENKNVKAVIRIATELPDENHVSQKIELRTADSKTPAKVDYTVETGADGQETVDVRTNTFAKNAEAQRALELMLRDLKDAPANDPSQSSLSTRSFGGQLAPLDSLTDNKCTKLVACNAGRVATVGAGTSTAGACALTGVGKAFSWLSGTSNTGSGICGKTAQATQQTAQAAQNKCEQTSVTDCAGQAASAAANAAKSAASTAGKGIKCVINFLGSGHC